MNVFELDAHLVGRYEAFSRSFTQIRAADLKEKVDAEYASRRFWPEALIGLNPNYKRGVSMADLVKRGDVDEGMASVFAAGTPRQAISLYRHQEQALAKAQQGRNYIVTTGTGSGKSLTFFIPIMDRILKSRRAGEPRRTRAVVIYPMNALANSQREELEKFIAPSGLPAHLQPTYARYTGQESESERKAAAANAPDIILTNFMMLELLMTRQDELDKQVMANMAGLEFLVLDELHTYRGRQGADVAMLVRRVRERVGSPKMLCIGTSATMASGDEDAGRQAVSSVGTTLFGSAVHQNDVITETLEQKTRFTGGEALLQAQLRKIIDAPSPMALGNLVLEDDALAHWIEVNIGLIPGETLRRRPPMTLTDAAADLAKFTGAAADACRSAIEQYLIAMSAPEKDRGGPSEEPFMAFKLHRFLSGAGHAHATFEAAGQRSVQLSGEKFDREKEQARLYPLFFCRECGQEVHSVSIDPFGTVLSRSIDITPQDTPDADGTLHGFLVPNADGSLAFDGTAECYPEGWSEQTPSGLRLVSRRRGKHEGVMLRLSPAGIRDDGGLEAWFFPGKYRFCARCRHEPAPQARDINKLAGLSAEGRSSATTMITEAALDWMAQDGSLSEHRRKLLGFTDNRQDAALQAGHFNDFIFVTLLRGAMLRAARSSGTDGLSHEQFGDALRRALGFEAEQSERRGEWMIDPNPRGFAALDEARSALNQVLAHRLWNDLRRGWRFTNPNLDQLGLIEVRYPGVPMLAADEEVFSSNPHLASATPEQRAAMFSVLLDFMRQGLAISVDALDPVTLEQIGERSRATLKAPWAIASEEQGRDLARQSTLMVEAPARRHQRPTDDATTLRAGGRSLVAREIQKCFGRTLALADREALITAMLEAAEQHQIVRRFPLGGLTGWRLAPNALKIFAGSGDPRQGQENAFFAELYSDVAERLGSAGRLPMAFEAREHTAQVESVVRQWREDRFRFGETDRQRLKEAAADMRTRGERSDFLPLLYCSPTMELGVDISQLNIVFLRNVPPTPANYAQRAGRAGRSGQAALVVTYCAAQSPHDQYYFERRISLVAGIVRAPAIDLANADLLSSHVQAEWLATTSEPLDPSIPGNLFMQSEELPVCERLEESFGSAAESPADRARASAAVRSALPTGAMIGEEGVDEFVERIWSTAAEAFSTAFDRWRDLYQSARRELEDAAAIERRTGLSAAERKDARNRYLSASRQLQLLEAGTSSSASDFYSYRYLATEGFLPGYNFPRLPLYAFIEAEKASTVLQRPRFLAIAEFGPNSLVYHEGKAFRCHRAKLPAGSRGENGLLATRTLTCCSTCGAAHEEGTQEQCVVCGAGLLPEGRIAELFRIDNVDATPSARITANDEDRQRRGFEIRTIFQWQGTGQENLDLTADGEVIATVRYGPRTRLSRVNLGLRRRAAKEIHGFHIDTVTGRWLKNEAEGEDEGADPRGARRQRIVPVVEDSKNAMLLQFKRPLEQTQMATLQHALVRAIETEHLLETGELLGEPLPSRESRNSVLLYEASEGGAGVLKRLTSGVHFWRELAERALELMHFRRDGDGLVEAEDACTAGCYRCLLSYYNQPDHELIERRDDEVLAILDLLSRCEVDTAKAAPADDPWIQALKSWSAPPPRPEHIDGVLYPLCWPERSLVAVCGGAMPGFTERCAELGRDVVVLPPAPGGAMPAELAAALGISA
ncbi:MAG: DEAD/DEAH box helicase [Allosphingosinicella sp.]|uniref:DEAD/DEAH box helicase n=1 Tax=Allosphingosinicella sp. TaxID=2823234 RepID=UPI0039311AA6